MEEFAGVMFVFIVMCVGGLIGADIKERNIVNHYKTCTKQGGSITYTDDRFVCVVKEKKGE